MYSSNILQIEWLHLSYDTEVFMARFVFIWKERAWRFHAWRKKKEGARAWTGVLFYMRFASNET